MRDEGICNPLNSRRFQGRKELSMNPMAGGPLSVTSKFPDFAVTILSDRANALDQFFLGKEGVKYPDGSDNRDIWILTALPGIYTCN